MLGFNFSKYDPSENAKSNFEKLLDLFTQLLTHTSGDFNEAMQWMNELDKEYKLTDNDYGIGDFLEDLKKKGYIDEDPQNGTIKISPKTEQGIRNGCRVVLVLRKRLRQGVRVGHAVDLVLEHAAIGAQQRLPAVLHAGVARRSHDERVQN